MTDLDELLKPIRERLEKATPGPWFTDWNYGHGWDHSAISKKDYRNNEEEYKRDDESGALLENNVVGVSCDHGAYKGEDLKFIAHCPTDMRRLLEAVEIMSEALVSIIAGSVAWPFDQAKETRDKVKEILK